MTRERILVAGAGVTGLAATCSALEQGHEVLCVDPRARAGGVLATTRDLGCIVEQGPATLLMRDPDLRGWLERMAGVAFTAPAAGTGDKRWVLRGGRPCAVPGGPLGLAGSRLLSARAKLRLLTEPFRSAPVPYPEDESVADFVLRRLGREWLDYLVGPFVSGVYAGDPAKLSVRWATGKIRALEKNHGSLIRGAMKKRGGGAPRGALVSCAQGLGALTDGLAARAGASLRLNTAVAALERDAGGWTARLADGTAFSCARVILACGAEAAARLLEPLDADAARFPAMPRVGLASVSLLQRREDFLWPAEGFGILYPRVEKIRTLGTLFMSSMFPDRAPAGHMLLTSYLGGSTDPEAVDMGDRKLLHVVQGDLKRAGILRAESRPVHSWVYAWPGALPQAQVGHGAHVALARAVEGRLPGLTLCGNAFTGVGLPYCLHAGREAGAGRRIHLDGEEA